MREGQDQGPLTDEALVVAYRADRRLECLDELVRRHTPAIRRLLFSIVLNDADADDLTQELFLRAFRSLDGYRGGAAFGTWLHRIAVNTALSYLERRRRMPVVFVDALPAQPAPASTLADQALHNRELDARMTQALAALSPVLRTALVLAVIEELPLAEAARRAGCNMATFYWRLHQARKLFRAEFAKLG